MLNLYWYVLLYRFIDEFFDSKIMLRIITSIPKVVEDFIYGKYDEKN